MISIKKWVLSEVGEPTFFIVVNINIVRVIVEENENRFFGCCCPACG